MWEKKMYRLSSVRYFVYILHAFIYFTSVKYTTGNHNNINIIINVLKVHIAIWCCLLCFFLKLIIIYILCSLKKNNVYRHYFNDVMCSSLLL